MKLYYPFLTLFYLSNGETIRPLRCFTCTGYSYKVCIAKGRNVTCDSDSVCAISSRKRDGQVYQISMGKLCYIFLKNIYTNYLVLKTV